MLRIDESAQYIFNSMTYRVQTPDGEMFVNIMEDKAGVICAIDISIGKAGGPLKAWAHTFGRIMTMGLEHGVKLEEFLTELSSQTSDKARINTRGIIIRSSPEGVYHALMQYRGDKFNIMKKEMGIKESDETPRIRARSR